MDRSDTTRFIRDAKAFARRKRWKVQTLSRRIFNGNPYGLERLEAAIKSGKPGSGPPHVNVLDAMDAFRELVAEDEEEREAA